MKKIFILVLFCLTCLAHAESFSDLNDFEKVEFLNNNSSIQSFPLNRDEINASFFSFAQERSEIWVDTILEGDFVQTADIEIKNIDAFLYKGEVIAYQVSIAAPALDTANENCLYSEETGTWGGEGCVAGEIVEKALADSNFRPIFSSQFPEFISH